MSLKDLKVTDEEFSSYGVISQPDTLTGTPEENKAVFDALIRRVSIEHINKLIDELSTSGAADMGTEPFGAVTATTVQVALEQIYALIGSTYSGTDGAGKVGFSGTSSIQASNVQAAIEAVQANLTAYIAKIKAATGAAEVGNAPIAGMTATNVQQALEELRKNIDNIVSGIIPGGSITSDMLQDGAVTEAKLSSDVAAKLGVLGGATTPQGALANLGAGVRPNELDNPGLCVNQRGQDSYTGNGGEPVTFDRWQAGLHTTIAQNGGNIVVSASGGAGYILQRLENPILGKPIVFSVLITSGLYECKGVVNSGGSITQETPFGAISVTHGARMYALIRLNDGQSITLPVQDGDVAKLEIGDTQTLAYQDDTGAWQLLPQPESDYATQLAKCQRYQLKLPYGSSQNFAPVGFGWAQNASLVRILIPTPITMRTSPAISYLSGDINGITIVSNGKNIVPNSITQIIVMNYGVAIEFAVSGADNSMPCVMRASSAYMLLDANL